MHLTIRLNKTSLRSKRFRWVLKQKTRNQIPREKWGELKSGEGKTGNPALRRSSVFLCSETLRKRLLHTQAEMRLTSLDQVSLAFYYVHDS